MYWSEADKIARLEAVISNLNAELQQHLLGAVNYLDAKTIASFNHPEEMGRAVEGMKDASHCFRRIRIHVERGIYPQQMPSSGSNIPNSQAQVQEASI